jgi:hypothetical protein
MEMRERIFKYIKANLASWEAGVTTPRAIQTFFESPEECLSGKFAIQPLQESDLRAMYPNFAEQVLRLPPYAYAYFFACNNAVFSDGKPAEALVSCEIFTVA